MKANELMVGDWVYAIDDNGEKHPCRANNLEYDYINKRGDFCVDFYGTGYDVEWPDITFDVEPIPLTVEILEKNGWISARNGSGDFNLMDPCIPQATVTKSIVGFQLNHGGYNGMCILYVHQLQHALRLCGIDKEIQL